MIAVGTAVVQVQRENARLPDITEIAAAQRQLWPAPNFLYISGFHPPGYWRLMQLLYFLRFGTETGPFIPLVLAYAP